MTYVKCGAAATLLLAVAGCAGGTLSHESRWRQVHNLAEAVGCFPYFTTPIREADLVDVILIGRIRGISFAVRTEEEESGEFELEVERVIYGSLSGTTLRLAFRVLTDDLGHIGGNSPPRGRAIFYLEQLQDGQARVIRNFGCYSSSQE